MVRLEEETARARGDRVRHDAGRDVRPGHDHAALRSSREDLAHGRADLPAKPGEVDDRHLRIGRAELVQEGPLVGHRPDEEHPLIAGQRIAGVVRRLGFRLEDEHADRTNPVHHLAIPNDVTR